MDRPLSDTEITYPNEPTQETLTKVTSAALINLAYWQRGQRDGPPALAGAAATLIAAIQRGLGLDHAQQDGPEGDAILNAPDVVEARRTWDSFIAENCPDQAPVPTSAPFAPAPEDVAFCADLTGPGESNQVRDQLAAEDKASQQSHDPAQQTKSFHDGLAAEVPRWEQALRDSPPELAADIATILDVRRRLAAVDPSQNRDAYFAALDAINQPRDDRAALLHESNFEEARCLGER